MPSALFETRNADGRTAECRVRESFVDDAWMLLHDFSGSSRDLAVMKNSLVHLIEVKNEDRFADSPNLCIELYQGKVHRKFSGIMLSETTLCVHTFGDKCIAYRTQYMRLHLDVQHQAGRYAAQEFRLADNGNGGMLVPKQDILGKSWAELIEISRLPRSRVVRQTA